MAVQFTTKEASRTSEYRFLPQDLAVNPDLNGRHELPDIQWLIKSILTVGQLQPVVISSDGGIATLRAGHSRWRAISEINQKKLAPNGAQLTIRCVYSKLSEFDGFIANIHENRERNPNTPIDDAHNIARLEKWGQTIEQIAVIYREDVDWVKGRLALITLEPEAEKAVQEGRLKITAARAIAKLSAAQQRAAVSGTGKVKPEAVRKASGAPERPTIKTVREVAQTAADDTTLAKATREWIAATLLPALGVTQRG